MAAFGIPQLVDGPFIDLVVDHLVMDSAEQNQVFMVIDIAGIIRVSAWPLGRLGNYVGFLGYDGRVILSGLARYHQFRAANGAAPAASTPQDSPAGERNGHHGRRNPAVVEPHQGCRRFVGRNGS
nr:hypothetical protein [Streptomyces sp. TS71-3]